MSQAPEDPKGSGAAGSNFDPAGFIEDSASPPPEPEPEPYNWEDIEEAFSRPVPPPIVQGILHPGEICFFYGEPGSGKTMGAIDLAAHGAKGEGLFAGSFQIMRPITTGYVTYEGQWDIPGRIKAAALAHDLLPEELKRVKLLRDQAPNLHSSDECKAFALHLKSLAERFDWLPDLLVFDTMAQASLGSDENLAKDAALIVGNARQIIRELGGFTACLLIHHNAKGTEEIKGSQALKGSADSALYFERKDRKKPGRMQAKKIKAAPDDIPQVAFRVHSSNLMPPTISGFPPGVIEWLGEYENEPSERKAGPARSPRDQKNAVKHYLCLHAYREDLALTVAEIYTALTGDEDSPLEVTLRTLGEWLKAWTQTEGEAIYHTQKSVKDLNGKGNRMAAAYYLETDPNLWQ
jgi:hypothetical protein